jgi:L-threonylcarbamoyladenylate synthase
MTNPTILNTLSNSKLVELLKNGAIGVLPTDTQYGLVACADSPAAAQRLYAFKKRGQTPGTLIAASIEQFAALGIPRRYVKAVEQFWPNAISVVVPSGPELSYLHLGKNSLAVRIPDSKELQRLLEQTGPLLTTSANPPSSQPAGTIKEAQDYFGDKVDFYVDGGDLSGRLPSTVIRIIDDAIEILREGAVKMDESGEIQT